MCENGDTIIPLAYRNKAAAAVVLVCTALFLVTLVAQVVLRIHIGVEGEADKLQVILLGLQILLYPAWVFSIWHNWYALHGKPALWLENDHLVLRFSGLRRIPLDEITQVDFERFASSYDPAKVTVHLRKGKPVTIWLHTLRLVSGFPDLLRKATAKPA